MTAKLESDNGKPIIDYFGLDKEAKGPQVRAQRAQRAQHGAAAGA